MQIKRLIDHPIISKTHFQNDEGDNINGPSLIKVPDWIINPLGKYYLYFAHHRGQSIRLAFSNELHGPWKVYKPGSLQLKDAFDCYDHIASPDVHIDHNLQKIRMYFHGVSKGSSIQRSYIAYSVDGLRFNAGNKPLADFYLRTVQFGSFYIGMSKGGVTYLSRSPNGPFKRIPVKLFRMSDPLANSQGDIRHIALQIENSKLQVYFTKIGDAPEQIYRSAIDISKPIANWLTTEPEIVLFPERVWEGSTLPLRPSVSGASLGPENALRDPCIFEDDCRTYLLYSVAGEFGLGIAEIIE